MDGDLRGRTIVGGSASEFCSGNWASCCPEVMALSCAPSFGAPHKNRVASITPASRRNGSLYFCNLPASLASASDPRCRTAGTFLSLVRHSRLQNDERPRIRVHSRG